jgi:cyclase
MADALHHLTRRDALRTFAFAAGAAVLPHSLGSTARAASPTPTPTPAGTPPQINATSLGGALTHISGAGGNILLFGGDDGAVVVDSGLPDLADRTTAELKKAAPLALLVNTHWHYDHVGANEQLASTGTRIMAHAHTRRRMSAPHEMEMFNRTMPASPPAALPRITFTDETRLHVNGDEIRLIPVPPAHTDGDVIVRLENADLIHAGDLYFNGGYPFIDYSSGGWLGGLVPAIRTIAEMSGPKTRIMPGHGPMANTQDLKRYLDFLELMLTRFTKLKEQGLSVDEAVAAQPAKEFDESLGKGFMKPEPFVRITYTGMLRHK